MTDDMMALRGLLEKSADTDLLREMIGFAAERLMELEVGSRTGAEYGEKTADRLVQRNGYRDRDWETRVVSAFIATAFAQETPEAAKQQWRGVADQLRPPAAQAGDADG